MSLCTHCDEEVVRPSFNIEDIERLSPFCCDGCLTVFNVIHQKGFEAYYDIKKNSQLIKRRSPVGVRDLEFPKKSGHIFKQRFG